MTRVPFKDLPHEDILGPDDLIGTGWDWLDYQSEYFARGRSSIYRRKSSNYTHCRNVDKALKS